MGDPDTHAWVIALLCIDAVEWPSDEHESAATLVFYEIVRRELRKWQEARSATGEPSGLPRFIFNPSEN